MSELPACTLISRAADTDSLDCWLPPQKLGSRRDTLIGLSPGPSQKHHSPPPQDFWNVEQCALRSQRLSGTCDCRSHFQGTLHFPTAMEQAHLAAHHAGQCDPCAAWIFFSVFFDQMLFWWVLFFSHATSLVGWSRFGQLLLPNLFWYPGQCWNRPRVTWPKVVVYTFLHFYCCLFIWSGLMRFGYGSLKTGKRKACSQNLWSPSFLTERLFGSTPWGLPLVRSRMQRSPLPVLPPATRRGSHDDSSPQSQAGLRVNGDVAISPYRRYMCRYLFEMIDLSWCNPLFQKAFWFFRGCFSMFLRGSILSLQAWLRAVDMKDVV